MKWILLVPQRRHVGANYLCLMLKEADGQANQHCGLVRNLSEATSVELLWLCPHYLSKYFPL